MGISMSYDYIYQPAKPERVLELLNEIAEDEARLDSITESYERVGLSPENDSVYQEVADRIRDNFYQAGNLYSKLPRDDHDDGELKLWTNKQMDLAGNWE